MKDERVVTLGMIGLGAINESYLKSISAMKGAKIAVGFDVSPEARRRVAEKWKLQVVDSIEELLGYKDIEGVTIATPNQFHWENVKAAAESGKHICVTKPVTNTLDEAEKCIEACEKASVLLMVGHEARYRAVFSKFTELLKEGVIGRISQIVTFFGSSGGLKKKQDGNWRDKWENAPGGSLNLLGVHNIDCVNSILGTPVSASARCKSLFTERELEDTTQSIVEYESGELVFFGTSYSSYGGWHITAYGTTGTLTLDFNRGVILESRENGEVFSKKFAFTPEGGFDNMFKHFIDCIRSGSKPSCSGEDGKMALAVNWASIVSEKENRLVTIEEAIRNYKEGIKK